MKLFSLLITSVSQQRPLCNGLLRSVNYTANYTNSRLFGSSAAKLLSSPNHISQSNHRVPFNRFCTSSKPSNKQADPKPVLIDYFRNKHSDAEQEQILQLMLNCDTNETDWYQKLNDRLVDEVYYAKELKFGDLNDEKIAQLKEDYAVLRSKRLVPPKTITDALQEDLLVVWNDEKNRRHFLAYQGIKQLKKFKFACRKQLKSMYKISVIVQDETKLKKKADEQAEKVEQKYEASAIYIKRKKSCDYSQQARLWSSALDGQNLVVDFSLSPERLRTEQGSISSQAQRIVLFNREADQPFNVWFTSLCDENIKGSFDRVNLFSPKNFVNRSERHFTELFPKEKLVYLSPDAEEAIDEFDRQAVYVLGALVDRYEDNPLTFNSAKHHGIRAVRLPLKEHIILTDLAIDLSFLSVFKMLNYMQLSYARWDNAFRMYLSPDRRQDEYDIIFRNNPKLTDYSMKEIENYNRRMKYQHKHRIFQKMMQN